MPPRLSPTAFDPAPWNGLLAEAARRHHVPGMVAGVLSIEPETGQERRMVAHTGLTNTRTGVATDADTLCQIGSITKVVTSTMIMQLQEEGRLELDTPVTELLPDLRLESKYADLITVWHLLTHTSGIDGDLFTDTGRGDDCVERYVAGLSSAEALFAPKTGWSYCNSGFVLLGRIIEVLDGRGWDASLRARVTERLGLSRFLTLPEEVMAHRYQYGHVRLPGARTWSPAPAAMITRSMGPAGLISSSVDDLLSFGAAFLRDGETGTGRRLLTPGSVAAMTGAQWDLDPAADSMAPQWGLGWMRDDWSGHPVFWHGGTTIGNNAWLQVLPEDGLAFVVFCNGGLAPLAAEEVYAAFAAEFAGARPTELVSPSGSATEVEYEESWLGRYADASTTVTVRRAEDGGLEAILENRLELGNKDAEVTVPLLPGGRPGRFVARPDDLTPWAPLSFTEIAGEPVAYLGIRALPRREGESA